MKTQLVPRLIYSAVQLVTIVGLPATLLLCAAMVLQGDIGTEIVLRVEREEGHPGVPSATIHADENGKRYAVAHDTDKRVVICTEVADGNIEVNSRFQLPEDGVPTAAIPYGTGHLCVLDLRGKLWFFRNTEQTGWKAELVGVLKSPRKEILSGVQPCAYHPKCGVIFASAFGSDEIWVVSVNDADHPKLLQRVAGKRAGDVTDDEVGTHQETSVAQLESPGAMVLTKDGRDLYVLDFNTPSIVHFRVSQTDGTLTFASVYDRKTIQGEKRLIPHSILGPRAIAVSSDGKQVYVGGDGNSLGIFERDANSGAIKLSDVLFDEMPGLSAMDSIIAIQTSRDGKTLAVTCRDSHSILLFERDENDKLKLRRQMGPLKDKAFRGLSDAVPTTGKDTVIITSSGVVMAVVRSKEPQVREP
ncbi:MAG: beta-propeller fold lactonase family protein [Pirellulaceae bacterium]|nr:beta-propeller fold lactonase family protein [Pirellulaceae bacterium]